ncbi:MAG: type IV pilus modification PilV family protein [Candidatus Binatia bacterium]
MRPEARTARSGAPRAGAFVPAAGLSLVEFLVAITVLTIAGAGLFAIASSATSKNVLARDQSTAMQLAVDKLEELRNTAFEDLASGSDATPITAGGESGGVYTRSWAASSRTIAGVEARDLAVTVGWAGGGSASLTTTVVQPNTIVPGFMDEFPSVAIRSWDQRQ